MDVHIGLDDTDSPYGMCTTYLGAILVQELSSKNVVFLDYPHLIRLNPNIPFKTRGNAAIAFHISVPRSLIPEILEIIKQNIHELSEKHGKTSPAAIAIIGKPKEEMKLLYKRAVRELLPKRYVSEIISSQRNIVVIKDGRGIVGSLAAAAAFPLEDFTYELLLYRSLYRREEKVLDNNSLVRAIYEIDKNYRPLVFGNIDYSTKRVLAIPRGPDPVLLGIRSIDPLVLSQILVDLFKKFQFERGLIYKTNQATAEHFHVKKVRSLRPYDAAIIIGKVTFNPVILRGGHVKIELEDSTGRITVMIYKETGRLNKLAKMLKKGDRIEVGGGVVPREGLTFNAEYIRVIKPVPIVEIFNPNCPKCGARLKSAGKNKGLKCQKCGYRTREARKIIKVLPRIIDPGLYIQSPRAYRHLSKPKEVAGLQSIDYGALIEPWHLP